MPAQCVVCVLQISHWEDPIESDLFKKVQKSGVFIVEQYKLP